MSDEGIPWFVVLDANGEAIADADGPKGNIGYPATPEEIAHFVGVLRKSVRKMHDVDVKAIEEALKAEPAAVEAAKRARTSRGVRS